MSLRKSHRSRVFFSHLRASQKSSFRPGLEALEDRTLPSITLNAFSVPSAGQEQQTLAFSVDATSSSATPVTYSWDFGDGTMRIDVVLVTVTATEAADDDGAEG